MRILGVLKLAFEQDISFYYGCNPINGFSGCRLSGERTHLSVEHVVSGFLNFLHIFYGDFEVSKPLLQLFPRLEIFLGFLGALLICFKLVELFVQTLIFHGECLVVSEFPLVSGLELDTKCSSPFICPTSAGTLIFRNLLSSPWAHRPLSLLMLLHFILSSLYFASCFSLSSYASYRET
jgi:hypothetical protein